MNNSSFCSVQKIFKLTRIFSKVSAFVTSYSSSSAAATEVFHNIYKYFTKFVITKQPNRATHTHTHCTQLITGVWIKCLQLYYNHE